MELATAGASLSGKDSAEAVLCKLSFDDFALSARIDIAESYILGLLTEVVEDFTMAPGSNVG